MSHRRRLIAPRSALRLVATALLIAASTFVTIETAHAQNPVYWFAQGIGAAGADRGNAIAIDGAGTLYVTGSFKGTVDFDPGVGTANLTSVAYEGTGDIFVASYDASGNYRWAFHVGGAPPAGMQADNMGLSIALERGNVVVSGLFNGTMDFNPGAGTATLTSNGWTTFVAKYDGNGNYLWAFQIGPYTGWNDVVTDIDGNVVVVGTFKGTVDFDPGAGTAALSSVKAKGKNSSGDQSDLFVAKYTPTGAYVWAFRAGSEFADGADAVDINQYGDIFVTGFINNGIGATSTTAVDFDPSRGAATLAGFGTFVARYTSSGAYTSAFKLGAANTQDGQRIAVDYNGFLVLTGGFTGTVDFDPGAGTANLTARSNNGSPDFFVARYRPDGTLFWAFSPATGSALGLAMEDRTGEIYVSGNFRGNNDFDPGSGTTLLERDATSDNGGFVASYSAHGDLRWAFSIPTGATNGRGIALHSNGNLGVTGSYRLTSDFDPNEGVASITPAGNSDIFIAEYIDSWIGFKPATQKKIDGVTMVAAPNPFTDAFALRFGDSAGQVRVEIVDMMGRIVEEHDEVDPRSGITVGEHLPAGAYCVRVTYGETRHQTLVRKLR